MICDICILIFMIFALFIGWKKGFVRSVHSVISIIVTVIAIRLFHAPLADALSKGEWLMELGEIITSSYIGFAADKCISAIISVLAAVAIYFASKIILCFAFRILDSIASLPIINTFNNILGLLMNGIVGAIWIVILVNLFYILPQTQNGVLDSKIVEALGIILIK